MLTGMVAKWGLVAGVVVTSLFAGSSEARADQRRHGRYERSPVRVQRQHYDYSPRRVRQVSYPRAVSYRPSYYRPVEYRSAYVDSPVYYYDDVRYSVPSCSRVSYTRPYYGFGASYVGDHGRSFSVGFGH